MLWLPATSVTTCTSPNVAGKWPPMWILESSYPLSAIPSEQRRTLFFGWFFFYTTVQSNFTEFHYAAAYQTVDLLLERLCFIIFCFFKHSSMESDIWIGWWNKDNDLKIMFHFCLSTVQILLHNLDFWLLFSVCILSKARSLNYFKLFFQSDIFFSKL